MQIQHQLERKGKNYILYLKYLTKYYLQQTRKPKNRRPFLLVWKMKYICRWHGMRYKITLLQSDHGCTCGWVSEFLVFSFFIHLLSNFVQRCWDKDCNYKMKVTQVHPGKWYALNWKNRQTGNFHTDSQIQNRYKRWRTKHSEGTANTVTNCSFPVEVLRKQMPEGQGQVQETEGRSTDKDRRWGPTESG